MPKRTPLARVEKCLHAFSAALGMAVFIFIFHDAKLDSYLLYNISSAVFALYTAVFVRNKFFNFAIILMMIYAAYQLGVYSGYDNSNSSPTQSKNEVVIVQIFVYAGWVMTALYFIWAFFKCLDKRSIAISANKRRAGEQ